MATKYQVFVSSTFEDLKEERDVVIKAILEMGHIPVGMEMFSAADEEQWKIIARHIEESDYYCVIVAHRYGSSIEGISYTRKEYEYAVECGVPVLGFIIEEAAQWPPDMVDKGGDAERVDEFKGLVKSKPVSFWRSTDDLYGKVSIALTKQMTANPRQGWVRASTLTVSPQVTAELSRLSAENATLRGTIEALNKKAVADHADEVRSAFEDLRRRKVTLSYKYASSDNEWSEYTGQQSWLFHLLAPLLASETSLIDAAKELAMNIREDTDKGFFTVAVNQLRDLLAEWMAFDLVEPSKRKHAVTDTNQYWTITPFGREVHKSVRRRVMEMRDASPPESEGAEATADPGPADTALTVERGSATGRPARKRGARGAAARP